MEQATNLFTKGLLLDTHPMVLSNDTLTDCLNGTLITMNGNEVILQNDMGNRRVDKAFLPPGYEPVGMKEYGGIIYVASYNPITNKSLIGSFPSPQKKLSSNTNGEALNFNFLIFTSGSNIETDEHLGITVMKSDSFMLPLTKDLTLRAGDKFAVYSEGLSGMSEYITNYSNVDYRFPNKAYTPKNRKYTMQLGVLNSQNEFVDITKTLCRWKDDNGTWKPVNYSSDVSEAYKFNDGYFISDTFTNTFFEETIADANLIKERQKIAANTYAYKLVGPLYLKIIMNHIENFNYNIYGIYNGSSATLWIEGYLTYNCPDGVFTTIGNSNENYATFDEGTPNNAFGFDLIGRSYDNIEVGESVYNPNNNTYTVKIVKKYTNVIANVPGTTIFNYVLGVKADIDTSNVYLRGLSVKGSIDLSLLGSGQLKFNGWRFYNNVIDETTGTSLLTFAFNAYPEYGKSFTDLRFVFKELVTGSEYTYPNSSLKGLPVYNGRQTISFGWSEIGLQPRKTYRVFSTYKILDNKSGTLGNSISLYGNSQSTVRWFLTTELFNEFYFSSSGVQDFCDLNTSSNEGRLKFLNKMVIDFSCTSNLRNNSREKLEVTGSLMSAHDPNINYLHDHIIGVKVSINPDIYIKEEKNYPDYIEVAKASSHLVQINSITLASIGDRISNLEADFLEDSYYDYSSILREQLYPVSGLNLQPTTTLALELAPLLQSSILPTENEIGGDIKYHDVFKAEGVSIKNIHNAFESFSKILNQSHVLPSPGTYGGVIVDFNYRGGVDNSNEHYLDVAINQSSDIGDLPRDHRKPSTWHDIDELHKDGHHKGNVDLFLGQIFQWFNESVKDTDKTFLYYFCERNKFVAHEDVPDNATGKNGAAFTRAWWKMPSGEWACFKDLYKRGDSFDDFIKSLLLLGNRELVYCMYDEYDLNSILFAPKEDYIYYDRYSIPMTYDISYKLTPGYLPRNVIDGTDRECGNLRFTINNDPKFPKDTIEFTLKSSEKFYDIINSVDSDNVSNVYVGEDGCGGLMEDSNGRQLNPSYIYVLDKNTKTLSRIDNRTDFYIDTVNKTRLDGANRLLYNINRKSGVEWKCQAAGARKDDTYTTYTYNLLNVVVPI